jgi:nitroreductase
MTLDARAFDALLQSHRSIRQFKPDDIPPAELQAILAGAIQGTSSSGNLNTFSVIVTRDPARRQALHELHMRQDMILQAPVLLTFCADTRRVRDWLALNGARDNFDHLHGFLVAAFDAMLLAQTVALSCEARGLGICYMGTTLNAADALCEFFDLPAGVFPVTTLVLGHPAESPAQRDRLPLSAYVHEERYERLDAEALAQAYAQRDHKGLARYLAMGEDMRRQWDELGLKNLAQYYTSKIKYDPERQRRDSRMQLDTLAQQDFLRHE